MKNYDGVLKIDGEIGVKKAYDPRSYLKAAETGVAERLAAACDDLLSSINERRIEDLERGPQLFQLETALKNLNNGQGLGFVGEYAATVFRHAVV